MPSNSASGRSSTRSFSSSSTTRTAPTRTENQFFPLAYPPPLKKTPHCLRRLTPKLLLQVQQLAIDNNNGRHRRIPVLEVWQPSIFNSRVAGTSRTVPKLGSRDVYITQCEGYLHLRERTASRDGELADRDMAVTREIEDSHDHAARHVVGVVCSGAEQQKSQSSGWRFGSKSVVYFAEDGLAWEASLPSPRIYRVGFRGKGLEWGKESGQDRFVLRVANQRRSWIASMTRTTIEVNEWDREIRDYFREGLISSEYDNVDVRLCTLIMTSGVWVAGQEGWFIN